MVPNRATYHIFKNVKSQTKENKFFKAVNKKQTFLKLTSDMLKDGFIPVYLWN